jgi:two-component system, LuxR family, response regulator FixJ
MTDRPLVHVIDDDEAARASVLFLLQTASINACAYASASDFLDVQPISTTGCIITDVRMPGMSGLELLRYLQANGSDKPVIMMTGAGDIPLVTEALRTGAFDFIEKPFDDEVLISAVRAALDPDRGRQQDRSQEEAAERLSGLTSQECAVMERIFAGQQNSDIARALHANFRTVEICRASILAKLGVGSFSEVVRLTLIAEGSRSFRYD